MAQRQRKGPPPKPAGGNNTVFYIVLGVIAVGGVLAIGYALSGRGGSGTAATELVDIEATDVRALYEQATPMRLGSRDAPVTIVEFGDFQCPGCGQFALSVKPAIQNQYVANGQAQFVYYDFPLVSIHAHAFLAARASRCAAEQQADAGPESPATGNTAYWTYHDKLFEEQANWSFKQAVVDDFVSYAGEVGLDEGDFGRCLRSDRYADVVTANRMLGDRLTITGTPTVIVNNRRVTSQAGGVPSALDLSQAIEQALGDQ